MPTLNCARTLFIQTESYLDLADFTQDHLQTQDTGDVLVLAVTRYISIDVSQYIKLVSAKEESPSFCFLLCISRFVSPQEFHIDFIAGSWFIAVIAARVTS